MSFNPLDSRQALVAEIAELVSREVQSKSEAEALKAAIETSLLAEARRAERKLAYLRASAAGVFAIFLLGKLLLSKISALQPPTMGGLAAALVWMTFSAGVLGLLRREWYQPWLRRAVPIADAVLLVGTLGLSRVGGDAVVGFPGLAATFAVLCVVLAFTGAFRLTRSAVQLTSGLAAGALLVAAALSWISAPGAGGALVAVALAGTLALGVTDMVRRVTMNEIGRVTLDRMYGEAQRIIDAREEILRIVAHDLRNPLNTISMATSLLMDTEPQQASKNYLRTITRAGDRMNRLIQDLLSVTTIEAGRLSIEPRKISADTLLQEALELLEPIAREKSITLSVVAASDLPAVRADATRMLQVFSNLVGNAIKFTPSGGAITLSAGRVQNRVDFSVSDTGPGIPADQIPRLFGKFWQAKRGDNRGVGLGLAIARGIVEAHGGSIDVRSEPGQGSVFSFMLPMWGERTTNPSMMTTTTLKASADLAGFASGRINVADTVKQPAAPETRG